jgi:hypothetical protein
LSKGFPLFRNCLRNAQQNLGPRETASSWQGRWSRTLLGRTPVSYQDELGAQNLLVVPADVRKTFEDILRAGSRLRVTWLVYGAALDGTGSDASVSNIYSKLVREGRAKSWKFDHTHVSDIEWTIDFEWVSRGDSTSKASTIAQQAADLTSVTNALQSSVNAMLLEISKIQNPANAATKAVPQLTLGQLERLANLPTAIFTAYARKIQQVLSTMKQVGEIVSTALSQPASLAQSAINLANEAVAVTNGFIDSMNRIPMELQSWNHRPARALQSSNSFQKITQAAVQNARNAQSMKQQVQQSATRFAPVSPGGHRVNSTLSTRAGSVAAVYVTKAGDTPQRVSLRFYQTVDLAEQILSANRLPLYTPSFQPGKILYIPAQANVQQRPL